MSARVRGITSVMRRAVWWAVDYAFAGLWQLRALRSRHDPKQFLNGTKRPVLILPGVYEGWQFMLPLIRDLHGRGHPVHVVSALGRNRASVLEGAELVATYLEGVDLSDVVIVAHSKGGLIGKQLMSFGATAARISVMVAAATPFAGSSYARFLIGPTLRSFAPSNATLTTLSRMLEANERIVSVFPYFDPHIPEGSTLVGAKNVRVRTAGHFRVLADPRLFAEARHAAAGHTPQHRDATR